MNIYSIQYGDFVECTYLAHPIDIHEWVYSKVMYIINDEQLAIDMASWAELADVEDIYEADGIRLEVL